MNTNLKEGYSTSVEAISTEQDSVKLYVGIAKAKDLIKITTVDYYDPNLSPTDSKQGYQRPAKRNRITQIGKYLIKKDGDGLFPSAVLLAARRPLVYDKKQGRVEVSASNPLQIVDGQHRIEGLRYVLEEKRAREFENYMIPFVIMEIPERIKEMAQFRIVNGTAKQVRTDLVNMILTATYAGAKRSEVPTKDAWRVVVSNVVDRLAKETNSPWRDAIILPGEAKAREGGGKIVPATSFISSLRPVYRWLKVTSGLMEAPRCKDLDEEIDFMYKVVTDFWRALKQVVPEAFEKPEDYVIQKTPGLFSLHKLLRHLLGNLHQGRRKRDVETFIEYLNESKEISNPDFWHKKGGQASTFGSMKGFSELYEILSKPYSLK